MDPKIIWLLVFLALSGFFSGAETALVSISTARVKALLKEKRPGAAKLLKLKENPKVLLTTILIGNNIVNIAAASLTTVIMVNLFGSNGVGIATGVLTLVILVFGEITPKNLAHTHNEKFALKMATPIYLLSKIFAPAIYLLNLLTSFIISLAGGKSAPVVTEEELKSMIAMGVAEGEVEKKEKEMIEKVFQMNDITAEEVMTPRTAMFCLREDMTLNEAMKYLIKSPYSRVPIIKGSKDNVVGILYVKDVLKFIQRKRGKAKLRSLGRDPYFVPENIYLNQLFKQFQDKKIHMAIVVDEFGGVAGLITMEDILEEIVGEIVDETDIISDSIIRLDKNKIIVDGQTELKEVNEILNLKMPGKENYTISKIILDKAKRIPKKGDTIQISPKVTAKIENASKKKIYKVLLTKFNKPFKG